jgi:hypothetical protein
MALPLSVALVALATKLFRISRKHCVDCPSPSLQAQTVEAAFRHGVDLLALGLRFATSSLVT